jgi:hypothetical protein
VDQCPDIDWCFALPDILRADGIAPPEPAPRKASGSKRKLSDDEVEVIEDDRDEKELKALLVSIIIIFGPGN